jgi:hypothetical protein
MTDGVSIESLISKAKKQVHDEERKKRLEKMSRRDVALERLKDAAVKYVASGKPEEQQGRLDRVTEIADIVAQSRISMAEAMVDLAERGLFDVTPFFRSIKAKEGSRVLWRGYIHNKHFALLEVYGAPDGQTCRIESDSEHRVGIKLNVARKCSGGYITHASGDGFDYIGESTEEEGAHVSMGRAYVQLYKTLDQDRGRDIMIPLLDNYFTADEDEARE